MDKNNPALFNNLISYILLLLGFSSYLAIILIEKDFNPSRVTLALNACSGIMFLATGQITAINNIKRDR